MKQQEGQSVPSSSSSTTQGGSDGPSQASSSGDSLTEGQVRQAVLECLADGDGQTPRRLAERIRRRYLHVHGKRIKLTPCDVRRVARGMWIHSLIDAPMADKTGGLYVTSKLYRPLRAPLAKIQPTPGSNPGTMGPDDAA